MRLAAPTAALVLAALLPAQPVGICVLLVTVLVATAVATETDATVGASSFGRLRSRLRPSPRRWTPRFFAS